MCKIDIKLQKDWSLRELTKGDGESIIRIVQETLQRKEEEKI